MNRRILAIILAVLLAVVGTTAVLIYVNQADARALEGQQAVSVLIAKEPIPAGVTAKAAMSVLAKEQLPARSVPSDALHTIEKDQLDLVTSMNIAQGQVLTRTMLVRESKQNDIVLPKGKLAVTIQVEPGSLGEVPLRRGFKVAIFDTFPAAAGAGGFTPASGDSASGNQATRLLLPKVEVISVIADKKKKDSALGKFLVTVAVSQTQAEKLIHALNTGTVSIAQVNDDSKVAPSIGIDTFHLFETGTGS